MNALLLNIALVTTQQAEKISQLKTGFYFFMLLWVVTMFFLLRRIEENIKLKERLGIK